MYNTQIQHYPSGKQYYTNGSQSTTGREGQDMVSPTSRAAYGGGLQPVGGAVCHFHFLTTFTL